MEASGSPSTSAAMMTVNTEPDDATKAAAGGEGNGGKQAKSSLQDSGALKQEATAHFKEGEWEQALAKYTSALGILPKRIEEFKPSNHPRDDAAGQHSSSEDDSRQAEKADALEPEEKIPASSDSDIAAARSILNANIGACYVKLGEYKEAVQACSEALRDDPKYVKALQRRAMCNEKIGTWSSLTSAEEDYNALLNILPQDSPLIVPTRRSLNALKPRLEEAKSKETDEMLDKLKGLGNRILGNFGLSTDNFKLEPNGQGGYSINFAR